MKNLFVLLVVFMSVWHIEAQTPQKMSYQAVIRDANGQLMKNRNIGMQVLVLQGSENGTVVFAERFFPSTNENGLVTVEIGSGLSVNGSFAAIDWKTGPFFIKTETDINGGANYTLSATSQLLSVPYALLAKNVENVPSVKMDDLTDVEATNIQAGQLLKWDGTNWKPANDATTGGPGTTYTPGTGISIDVNNVISNTGDLSNTNELQQLELAGNQLKLTGANTVTLPTGTTYTAGQGISLANNTITNTGDNDNDADNELQQLTLSGTVLTLSQNGGSVTLPTSGGGGGDNWGTQTVETDNTISGAGTPSQPLKIANQNATNGQVLKNNGSTWLPGTDNDNQSLSVSGNQLTITNGNTINLPVDGDGSPTNEIQTLSINGQTLNLSQGGGSVTLPLTGDNWGTQTVAVQSNMSGNGTSSNPIGIANGGITTSNFSTTGATLNDTYVFDGNQWVRRKPVNITVDPNSGLDVRNVQGGPLTFELSNKLWSFTDQGNVYRNIEEIWLGVLSSEVILGWNSKYHDIQCVSDNSKSIGSSSKKWKELFVNKIIGAKHEGDWLPTTNGDMDLGSSDFKWDKLYTNSIIANTIQTRPIGDWLPLNNGFNDLGSTSFKWNKLYTNTIVGAKCDGDWIPAVNGTMDLGSSSFLWDRIYVDEIGSATYINGNFRPSTDGNRSLGISSNRWLQVHATNGTIQTSDRRLKKNIKPVSYGLKDVMKIKPVTWEWKNQRQPGTFMGFVAQDLLEVVPSAVYVPTEEDYKEYEEAKAAGKSAGEPSYGIRYSELIPVLTKAIQEQQVMIEEQNKKIDTLINKIEILEKK